MLNQLSIVRNCDRKHSKVALTFDDGPNPWYTPQILDVLKDHGCLASFFLIGRWACEQSSLVNRILNEGHTVGGHTFTHGGDFGTEPFSDFLKGLAVLENMTGRMIRFLRVPELGYDKAETDGSPRVKELLQGELHNKILKKTVSVIDCDVDSEDWRGISASDIVTNVLAGSRSGSIILLHDGSEKRFELRSRGSHLLTALPKIIDSLRSNGSELVTLDNLHFEYTIKTVGECNL